MPRGRRSLPEHAAGQGVDHGRGDGTASAHPLQGRSGCQLASRGEGTRDASAVPFPHPQLERTTADRSAVEVAGRVVVVAALLAMNDPSGPRRGVLLGLSTDHAVRQSNFAEPPPGMSSFWHVAEQPSRRRRGCRRRIARRSPGGRGRCPHPSATSVWQVASAAVTRGEVAVVARLVAVDHGVAAAGGTTIGAKSRRPAPRHRWRRRRHRISQNGTRTPSPRDAVPGVQFDATFARAPVPSRGRS